MNLRKKIKAFLSVCLSVVIIMMCMLPCFAQITYPAEITKEQTLASISKTDTVINSALKVMQNATLKDAVLPGLYGGDLLSSLLTGIYSMIEEQAGDTLRSIGINTSVSSVASHLGGYGDVSQRLSAYSTWAEADLTGAQWGVDSKEGFARAASAVFAPFNELLYALLCSGSYSLNLLIGIKGSNGYETAIIPALRALGCRYITTPSTFYANAQADKSNVMFSIVWDVLTLVEDVLDAPCDRLTDILPSIANYLLNGGFESAVSTLTEPLKLQVFNIQTSIAIEGLAELISDAESFSQNVSFDINSMLSGTGLKAADLDLALLASCGSVSGDTFVSDKADTFIVLLHWLIDTLKLNKDSLGSLMPEMDSQTQQIIASVLSKDTSSLVIFLISLLNQTAGKVNNYQWTFKDFVPGTAVYTPNLTAEKYQRVADTVDEVVNEFLAEMSEEKSLSSFLKKEIYSSSMLTTLIGGIYGALEGEEIKMITSLVGIDTSPSAIALQLSGDGLNKAAESLYALPSWSTIGEEGINWGVKTGNKEQFTKALLSALSPLEGLLGMLLAEGNIQVFGAVNIYGSNGYNTAIIPIYEALGCDASTIKSYSEFKALCSLGRGPETLIEPLLTLIDRIIERPVYTVLSILPNLLYFADSGLAACIENLMYPFKDIITSLGLEQVVDISSFGSFDVNKIVDEFIASSDMGINLPEIDIAYISSLGTRTEMLSKRTLDGQPVTVPYIQADMPALSVTLLRIVAGVMKTPGNEELMTSFMGAGGEEGGNEMFANFSSGIGPELEAMTEDETVEWLYKLFFRERATVQTQTHGEEYMPTIIYKPVKDYTALRVALIFAVCILLGLLIAVLRNKEKVNDWLREAKWQEFMKKYNGKQEV